MSGDDPRRKDLVSSLDNRSRRAVVKGLAGFAVFGGMSTAAAGSENPSTADVDAVFENHAQTVLSELAAAGVLSNANASELRTDKPIQSAADTGVGRFEHEGTDVYAVRQETDEGRMAMFVVPEDDESFALLNTDSGVEQFGDDVAAEGACGCESAWHCVRGEEVCYGLPTGICCP